MAKDKKNIDKLKTDKSVKTLPTKDMGNVKGGNGKKRWWSKGCGGIIPQ
jgi:hypothetical protein